MKKPYPAAFHGFTGGVIVPAQPAPVRIIMRRGRSRNPLRVPPLIVTSSTTVGHVIQPDELKPWQDVDDDDEIL